MITPEFATFIIVGFLAAFGIVIPILNKKFPSYISYRWCVVVVILSLLIGAVVNYKQLSDEARYVVLLGGMIIAGGYVLLRTLEKVLANGWLKGAKINVKKDDWDVSLSSDGITAEQKPETKDNEE